MSIRSVLLASALTLTLCACKTTEPEQAASPTPAPAPTKVTPAVAQMPAKTAPKAKASTETELLPMPEGLDAAAMDTSVSPCDDFYQYACGTWLKKTEIPADKPTWSRGFSVVAKRNRAILHKILEETAAGKAPEGTAYAKQLGDYWSTCMDEPALEKSLPVLKKELAHVEKVKSRRSLMHVIAWMQKNGMSPGFGFGPQVDFHDATQVIASLDQGGLGLPDRDYYLKNDAKKKAVREAYVKLMTTDFGLLGQSPKEAAASAKQVMTIETALAKASMSRVDRRVPKNLDHMLTVKALRKTAPGIHWKRFFHRVGAPKISSLNVSHPPFFTAFSKLVKSQPLSTWRTYLTWVMVRGSVPALPKSFRDASFAFKQVLTGAKKDLPRWKKCVRYADGDLGEALARPYVAETFGGDAKAYANEMVKDIQGALASDLKSVPWMDDATRQKAVAKLDKVTRKIGYPDQWRNYDALKTNSKSFLLNSLAANRFEMHREMAKIGKPIDRHEWEMTPPTVNAYYDPSKNEIVFPAGILQTPFFNSKATAPVNFGGIGMVVGHENTHGFDDEGRHFDGQGNLTDWWTKESSDAFDKRAACVAKQFSGYTAVGDMHLNGKLTLGENIADLGGLKLAHAALETYLQKHPDQVPAKSRFTPDQQFFLGFAQSWCTKRRPAFARMLATVDPHSPPHYRVNGPLSNLKSFREAFSCKPGDKMVRKDSCEIW